jgi:Putative amidoligase enzyme
MKAVAQIQGAKAGLEFEMVVPNIPNLSGDDEYESEPDYGMDEKVSDIDDAVRFFDDREFNSPSHIRHLENRMREDYNEWRNLKLSEWWNRKGKIFFEDWVKENLPDEEMDSIEELWDAEGDEYEKAKDDFADHFSEKLSEDNWFRDADIRWMTDVRDTYGVEWPYWTEESISSGSEENLEYTIKSFKKTIGREVNFYDSYHSGSRLAQEVNSSYIVEPDSSIDTDDDDDGGLEFVSPPLSLTDMISDLHNVCKWAIDKGCYTNKTTGLHMNVSIPNFSHDKLDYVKLALLLGDQYVLNQFGRASNTYCKSAIGNIQKTIENVPDRAIEVLDGMKAKLNHMATQVIHNSMNTEKYTSIGIKNNRIEFRSPGGDWLGIYSDNPGKLTNTLLRFVVALDAACDPNKYREEYLKKLYKLLSNAKTPATVDSIQFFSEYVSGNMTKTGLIRWLRELQKHRRGETPQPQLSIYDEGALEGDTQRGFWVVYDKNNKSLALSSPSLPKPNDNYMRLCAQVLNCPIENLRVRYMQD